MRNTVRSAGADIPWQRPRNHNIFDIGVIVGYNGGLLTGVAKASKCELSTALLAIWALNCPIIDECA